MDTNDVQIKIGKTVIETLTQGMYEDSRFIFREYVQNSCDAIDKAVETSVLKSRKDGEIYISIDKQNQSILFEDNGTGINSKNVFSVLGDIALSEKDRTKDKGFRGIGRLGGLGYCERLVFETSSFGEAQKTIMIWDAFALRQKLYDKSVQDDAGALVKSIIKIESAAEETEKHYFKIILESVDNDDLLNIDDVHEYLSMVAPVPYPVQFCIKEEIYAKSKEFSMSIDEYNIFINGSKLEKPYKMDLYEESTKQSGHKKYDEITKLEFFEFNDATYGRLAWGWYGISRFEKQIPKRPNFFRCIRLRKGNIQIGNENTLRDRKIPKEDRANGYFVGEIFCVHPDLIPNSRRDYFNENEPLKSLEQKLRELFHGTLHDLYYTASNLRSEIKKVNKVAELHEELAQKQQAGGFVGNELTILTEKIKDAAKAAETAQKKIEKIKSANVENSSLKRVVDSVEQVYTKQITAQTNIAAESITENPKQKRFVDTYFSRLPKEQRKLLDKIFQIIKDTLIPDEAEELIIKIKDELQ